MNEVLFMEIRLLRMFKTNYGMNAKDINALFERYGIWEYIESCYDALHVSSDECAFQDIVDILNAKGCVL